MKQETLEEAVEKYAEENKFGSDRPFEFNRDKHAFKQGAKWQEQNSDKKYSEEDMKQAFTDGSNTLIYDEINYKSEFKRKMNEWLEEYKRLEQFKKK